MQAMTEEQVVLENEARLSAVYAEILSWRVDCDAEDPQPEASHELAN